MTTPPNHKPDAAADARELHRLGYAQELFRTMGGFSNFALSFSIISILTGAVTLYGHGLTMGGPAEMAWGWPLVTVFTLAVAMSMAELASALPTSGAMYHWSARLGGKGWGWFTAWFNIVGNLTLLAGVDFGCAQFVTPLVGLDASTRNLLLVYAVILLSHALINHFGIRLVARLNDLSVAVHILGIIVIVGALFLFAPKQPASFFFERVTHNPSGWPYWGAFIVGLLQAQWTFTGYDASAAVSEETVDPRRRAPWGMVMAVVVSSVVGYLLLVALTLAIKDIGAVLTATDQSGNPMPAVLVILQTALGERAGSIFSAMVSVAMWFCGLSAVTWCSRVVYAFARDEGLPASRLWRRVSRKHQTPSAAIWLSVVVAWLAAVSSGAYQTVTAISVIGLYLSYVIPVYLSWRNRLKTGETMRGPWHLGKFSGAINLVALVWVAFISVVLCFPDDMRAGKAIIVLAALLGIFYLARERRRFPGPAFQSGTADDRQPRADAEPLTEEAPGD
ncbi:MAG TPA: amino acid permease [Blastocatellia bacterium]|nr:amino acid permease [Blastocatellia bacterium]